MRWVRRDLKILIPAGVVLAGIGIYLFFFVFAFHLLFIDDKVDEVGPVFDSGADEAVVIEQTPGDDDAAADGAASDGEEAVVGTDENKVDKSGPGVRCRRRSMLWLKQRPQ